MQTLPGIGPLRAAHIIQLSALFGLIPIHLYIYMLPNFNVTKGPTVFFSEQMCWDKSSFQTQYIEELSELQKLYSNISLQTFLRILHASSDDQQRQRM